MLFSFSGEQPRAQGPSCYEKQKGGGNYYLSFPSNFYKISYMLNKISYLSKVNQISLFLKYQLKYFIYQN